MQVIKLTLEHFKGITSGRGKNRIEVDFSKHSTDVKLVALFGPNGSSKTTIMDNMHPYRVMPSRASAPTPSSFSYYPQVTEGKDALKDVQWSHKNREFRSVIRIRSTGKTNKQECYLTEKVGDAFIPYCDSTGLTSDGKTDTYDRAVEVILGKPEVFFATQFSAQGKKPISTMTAGEVKALMAAMLTMGSFKTLSEKANDVVKGLKVHLSASQAQLLPLELKIFGTDSLNNQRANLIAKQATNSELITQQKSTIKAQGVLVADLELTVFKQEAVVAQRLSLDMQLASVREQNNGQLAEFSAQQARDRVSVDTAKSNADNGVRVAQNSVANAKLLVSNTLATIEGEGAIVKAQAVYNVNRSLLTELKAQEIDFYVDDKKFKALTELVAQMRESFAADKSTGIALVQSVEAARAIASLIGEVPCTGHTFSSSCKLLAEANAAAVDLPQKESRVVDLRAQLQGDQIRLRNNNSELQRLVEVNAQLQTLVAKISVLELELNNAKVTLKNLPALEKAKLEIDALRSALSSAERDLMVAKAVQSTAFSAVQSIVTEQESEQRNFHSLLYKEQARIQLAINELPVLVLGNEIHAAKQKLDDAEKALCDLEIAREGASLNMNIILVSISEVETAKSKLAETTLVCDAISQKISQWSLLSKALGNDGIIAMSIDDAGPEISALCNSLLKDCAGGRFNVSLSTQASTASGALKEAFLINVEDTLRDEQKELGQMSGGEKVWINECLVRAMALYMAQSTGSDFKTLFSDEADGPLDPERKRQYMAMKRTVLERGGYEREFIITQTPELLLMCDEVIDVTTL